MFCNEHNWNEEGLCHRCGINYHVDLYQQLKRARLELARVLEENESLRQKLAESEIHIRRIRARLKELSCGWSATTTVSWDS